MDLGISVKYIFIMANNPVAAIKCSCTDLEEIPPVDIDPEGEFNYVLLRIHCERAGVPLPACMPSILVVRGTKAFKTHQDILYDMRRHLQPRVVKCLGGGKINHEPVSKKIHVFGGKIEDFETADHARTAEVIKGYRPYSEYTVTAGKKDINPEFVKYG